MKFEIYKEVNNKITVSWDVMPYAKYRRFGGTRCLHYGVIFQETSILAQGPVKVQKAPESCARNFNKNGRGKLSLWLITSN
jgi:hypothetical protein